MTINLVRPCKNVIFKHLLKGDSSVTTLKIKACVQQRLNAKYQSPVWTPLPTLSP